MDRDPNTVHVVQRTANLAYWLGHAHVHSISMQTSPSTVPCQLTPCTVPYTCIQLVVVRIAHRPWVPRRATHNNSPGSAGVPCQIIPHPLAQSASALGSRKIFYDSLFSTLRLAALIEWETEIRQAGEAVFLFRKRRK